MATTLAGASQHQAGKARIVENLPSAKRLMSSLRSLGYDSYRAIMDIVDNSLDANAKHVDIQIEGNRQNLTITISDDGHGMDEDTLREALRLGSETEHEITDLGTFGLGLVTASISQARRIEVVTKTDGGPVLRGGFDLDDMETANKFLIWLEEADAGDYEGSRGTAVSLSKIDNISNWDVRTFGDTLRKRIGQTFRKFLRAGTVIRVNEKEAEPIDPLMINHPETQIVLDDIFEIEDGKQLSIKAVELPDLGIAGNSDAGITPRNAGFYVVRNNREILVAESFDLFAKHAEVSHFRAELSFDGALDGFFRVDVTKSRIDVTNQAFVDKVREVCLNLVRQSASRKRSRANVERGGVNHKIAEDMIVRKAKLLPKPPALIERRKPRMKGGAHGQGDGTREREPKHHEFKTPSGLKVIFEEGDYGDAPYYQVRQERSTIVITYNREHPFWRELVAHSDDPKVIALLDYITFGLCMSELMQPEAAQTVRHQLNATLWAVLA